MTRRRETWVRLSLAFLVLVGWGAAAGTTGPVGVARLFGLGGPATELLLPGGPVSPDGRFVVAQLTTPSDVAAQDIATVVVDWRSGRIVGSRRAPVGSLLLWEPRSRWFARAEDVGRGQGRTRPLVCRKVPDLAALWRVAPAPIYWVGTWSLDGGQFIAAEGHGPPGKWALAAVSRSGRQRGLVGSGTWVPWRVVRHGGAQEIVCGSLGRQPSPLTLLRMDGSVAGRMGPALPPGGLYLVPPRPDQFAWQAPRRGACYLFARGAHGWRRTPIRIPAPPLGAVSMLMASGDSHLMVIQNSRPNAAWSVDWTGRLRRLRLPGEPDDAAWYPWTDGRHLLRAVGTRLELADGYTGRIVRTVIVPVPK